MAVTLKHVDPAVDEDPAVRAYLDHISEIVSQMHAERMSDLICFGFTVSLDGKRCDPLDFLSRDSSQRA